MLITTKNCLFRPDALRLSFECSRVRNLCSRLSSIKEFSKAMTFDEELENNEKEISVVGKKFSMVRRRLDELRRKGSDQSVVALCENELYEVMSTLLALQRESDTILYAKQQSLYLAYLQSVASACNPVNWRWNSLSEITGQLLFESLKIGRLIIDDSDGSEPEDMGNLLCCEDSEPILEKGYSSAGDSDFSDLRANADHSLPLPPQGLHRRRHRNRT